MSLALAVAFSSDFRLGVGYKLSVTTISYSASCGEADVIESLWRPGANYFRDDAWFT